MSEIPNTGPDFSHLVALKVDGGKRADYVFRRLEGRPTLTVRHAGMDTNRGYIDALLKRAAPGRTTLAIVNDDRDADLELFPIHVVLAWPVPPRNAQGEPVPFSEANCRGFLKALRDNAPDIYDSFRAFAKNIDNFRPAAAELDPGN